MTRVVKLGEPFFLSGNFANDRPGDSACELPDTRKRKKADRCRTSRKTKQQSEKHHQSDASIGKMAPNQVDLMSPSRRCATTCLRDERNGVRGSFSDLSRERVRPKNHPLLNTLLIARPGLVRRTRTKRAGDCSFACENEARSSLTPARMGANSGLGKSAENGLRRASA